MSEPSWINLAVRITGGVVAYLAAGVALTPLLLWFDRITGPTRMFDRPRDADSRAAIIAAWPIFLALCVFIGLAVAVCWPLYALGRLSIWIFPGGGDGEERP